MLIKVTFKWGEEKKLPFYKDIFFCKGRKRILLEKEGEQVILLMEEVKEIHLSFEDELQPTQKLTLLDPIVKEKGE